MVDPLKILSGILLLLLGRRLFWLFVGLIGFAAGMLLGTQYFGAGSQVETLLVAVLCGILGIVVALFLQKLAIALGGFFAGGYFALSVASRLASRNPQFDWMIFVVGGILGAILLSFLFDWALIFLSSASGSILLLEGLHVAKSTSYVVFPVLLILGILVQAGIMVRQRRRIGQQPAS